MKSCEHYQAQLLEHLYGLLEAEESLALIEHAGQCDLCRGALLRADSQRQLLSAAAVSEFPAVRFSEPEVVPAVRPMPVKAKTPRRQIQWRRWAVAAAVIVGFTVIGVPVARYTADYRETRGNVESAFASLKTVLAEERKATDDYETALHKAEVNDETIRRKLDELGLEQERKIDELNASKLVLVATGHSVPRIGVPNEYRIETRNLRNDPTAAKLKVLVRDKASGKAIKEETVDSTGVHIVKLSPDSALKAGSQLVLEVEARSKAGQEVQIKENLTLARPAYVTHLATDKPMYHPGETIRFRSLTLDRYSLRPPSEEFRLIYSLHTQLNGVEQQIALYDESGKEIAQFDQFNNKVSQLVREPRVILAAPEGAKADPGKAKQAADKPVEALRGIGAGAFMLPAALPGGEYTLQVRELDSKFPAEKRKFLINNYQPPSLNKELKSFDKSSYGAGAEVVAHLKVSRAEGGTPLAGQPVVATVRVDGKYYDVNGTENKNPDAAGIPGMTDALGEVAVRFKLPATIERGDAMLSVEFTDGAAHEALSKPIPVAVRKLNLEFYPEGGNLIAGVPNRVYFQARTLIDKPAEIKGHIEDADGKTIEVFDAEKKLLAGVETFNDKTPGVNQGMGEFTFTPQAKGKYRLVIDSPEKIEGNYLLPEVQADGVALSVLSGVTNDKQPISVVVTSSGADRELLVGAYCRGSLLDHKAVKAEAGKATTVDLTPGGSMGGVYRITVFEKQPPNANEPLKPVAERLVYREPSHRLNITITGKKVNAPGDKVTLTLKTSSESGEPLPTVLLVGVVDKSVVTMADERTARALPTHFLLTSEVRRPEDLEFADVLLTDNLQARKALDLLLGTQGWRRFAESDPDQFRQRQPKKDMEDARVQADLQRVLVSTSLSGEKGTQRVSTIELEKERLLTAFRPKFEELEAEKLVSDATLEEARERGDANSAPMKQMRAKVEAANGVYQGSLESLKNFENRNEAIRRWSMVSFGLLLLLAGGISLVVTLLRQVRQAIPVYIAALGMVGLCAAVMVATDLFHFQQPGPTPVAVLSDKPGLPLMEQPEADGNPAVGDDQGGGANNRVRRGAGEGGGVGEREEARWKRDGNAPPPPPMPPAKNEKPNEAPKDVKKGEPTAVAAFPPPPKPNAPVPENKEKQADRQRERADKAAEGKKADEAALFAGQHLQGRMAQGPKTPQQMQPGFGAMNNAQMDALRKATAYRALEEQIQKFAADGKDADVANVQNRQEAQQLRDARQAIMLAATPTVVRVYAHQHRASNSKGQDKDAGVRTDFAETLYWHPALVVPGTGEAKIEFDLNDAERSFQVLAAGHSGDGRLGSSITDIESRKPFSLAAAVPLQVVASDTITLPVSVRNASPEDREVRLNVAVQNLKPAAGSESGLTRVLRLKSQERTRVVFNFQPTIKEGTARVILTGTTEPFGSDSIAYDIAVVPEGFPVNGARSDMLEKAAEHDVKLPKEWVATTLKAEVSIYPSRLSDLQQGLAALLREPNGCFEQTSSSNYPNILVLDYLEKSKSNDPQTQQRARDLLTRGYAKLVTFECQKAANQREGYEWFGGNAAPHEALTAYGLMEFYDMQRLGHPVDKAMIERTRQYLLSRRDKKGGFSRNQAAIDTFGRAPEHLTNAYIVWALTETDPDNATDLKMELDALVKGTADSKDPYYLALVANSLLNRKMGTEAGEVLKKLAATQNKEGGLDGAQTSITSSGGRDLQIETTALGVLAWLKTPRPHNYEKNLNDAIKWIGQQRGGYGGFGSTQSTILALKALTAFTAGKASSIEPGEIALIVNGKRVATAAIGPQQKDTLTLVVQNPEEVFKAGEENKVEILSTSKTALPYTLSWSYMTRTPDNAAQPPVRLATKLDRATALDGQAVNLTIEVTNTTDKDQGMVTAIIGLPAGLSLPEDFAQLKDYLRPRDNGKEAARISHFEIRGRDLVIYWRGMKAKDTVKLDLTLNCRVPGEYRGAASRAYLYYNADQKHWVEPIKVNLKAD